MRLSISQVLSFGLWTCINDLCLQKKTQADAQGARLAANDSDNIQFNHDTYSYMWPRDGALVSIAMIRVGFPEFTKPFFRFCKSVMWWAGCLLHKYNPDGTLGSSWHPWVEYGEPSLPIQEDETSLVIHALWEYYEATGDIEFVKEVYEPLLKDAVFFMSEYKYPNDIPVESYDLWEERRGILPSLHLLFTEDCYQEKNSVIW